MRSALVLAAVLGCGGITAQAAMLAYSGLEGQSAGTLTNTINDGAAMQPWDPQDNAGHAIANTAPLTFGGLMTSPEGNYITGTGSYKSVGRRIQTGPGGVFESAGLVSDPWTLGTVDSGTVWFSFLARVDATTRTPTFRLHQENIAWSDGAGVMIGTASGTWSAALTTGTLAATTATIQANTTTLMVGRLGFNGADSSFHFWAFSNPADVALGGADLSLASATSSVTGVAASAMDFKSFKAYLANSSASRAFVDEVRFGTSFADVTPVPEPTALAAVMTAGLLLVRRRK